MNSCELRGTLPFPTPSTISIRRLVKYRGGRGGICMHFTVCTSPRDPTFSYVSLNLSRHFCSRANARSATMRAVFIRRRCPADSVPGGFGKTVGNARRSQLAARLYGLLSMKDFEKRKRTQARGPFLSLVPGSSANICGIARSRGRAFPR